MPTTKGIITGAALTLMAMIATTQPAAAHSYEIQGPYFVADPLGTSTPLAAGDIDGDGRNDLVSCFSSYRIVVLRQGEDRRLHPYFDAPIWTPLAPVPPSTTYVYSVECRRIEVADMNSDGRDDIVVAHSQGVTVLLAQASGGFARQEARNPDFDDVGTKIGSGVLLDVDGDSDRDLLVSRFGGVVGLLKNDGRGHLANEVTLPSLVAPGQLVAGDLDADGREDFAVTGTYLLNPSGDVTYLDVFLNRGNDQFVTLPHRLLPPATYVGSLAIGDVTGDGKDDIVVTSSANRPRAALFVFKQEPGGIGESYDTYLTLDLPKSVAIADMDGDGLGDIVVNHHGWWVVGTYLQTPGAFVAGTPVMNLANNNDDPQAFAIGDFNSDGCRDIAVSVSGQYVMAFGKDCRVRTGIFPRVPNERSGGGWQPPPRSAPR